MPGQPYYVTTAIAYPNGPPHIGHAYEVIATDAIARFQRLDGHDVYFLTGTDEHGIKMHQTAAREKLTPRELVARNVPIFQAMVKKLNCSNDDYIRTTEPRHYRSSEAIWSAMQKAGDIYLDKYAGWYSVRTRPITTRARRASTERDVALVRKARRSNGSRRRAISSDCPNMPTSSWHCTKNIPTSCCPKSA